MFLLSSNYLWLYFYFFLIFKKFIYFWLCWVFVAVRGLSLVVASGGYSLSRYAGFSLWWLLLLQSTGSRRTGFSSCGTRAQQLWLAGLVAPRHVGSSQTRTRTCVLCTGRRILNHCTTRETPTSGFILSIFKKCILCSATSQVGLLLMRTFFVIK